MFFISSLGPDDLLLDNGVISDFCAMLDWANQRLVFHSSNTTIHAVNRFDTSDWHPSAPPKGERSVFVAAIFAAIQTIYL